MELTKRADLWKVVEVYEFYDKPLIYTAQQPGDDKLYLHYFVDDETADGVNFSTYMVFPIGAETLKAMETCSLSLRKMLLAAEDMHLFHFYFEQQDIRMEAVKPEELPSDYIPDDDIYVF